MYAYAGTEHKIRAVERQDIIIQYYYGWTPGNHRDAHPLVHQGWWRRDKSLCPMIAVHGAPRGRGLVSLTVGTSACSVSWPPAFPSIVLRTRAETASQTASRPGLVAGVFQHRYWRDSLKIPESCRSITGVTRL